MRALVFAIVAAVALACARADACPDDAAAVRAALDREATRARYYDAAWAIGFGATAIASAATAELAGSDLATPIRDGLWITAGQTTIAALSHLVLPLRIERVAVTGDACADHAASERALATTARHESFAWWLGIAGGLALNGSGVLYLGLHDHAWANAALAGAIGISVGLFHTWTLGEVHVDVNRSAGVTALRVGVAF